MSDNAFLRAVVRAALATGSPDETREQLVERIFFQMSAHGLPVAVAEHAPNDTDEARSSALRCAIADALTQMENECA